MASNDPLVWIDCEMTGLDPTTDTIMSIACFITDAQLNLLDPTGFEATIHHSQEQLNRMGEWCTKHHSESGLSQACLDSSTTEDVAARDLLRYIKQYVHMPRTALLAGNSVHADRGFLVRGPWGVVVEYLHYRILDVSSIKEAVRRWASEDTIRSVPEKKLLHEARADILESIAEARYYRDAIFRR